MLTPSQHSFARPNFLGALAVLVALTSPLTVVAQQPMTPIQVDAANSQSQRADTLEAYALGLHSTPSRFLEAAQLHERAARMRGEDPKAVASFRTAGWLYSAVGRNDLAREMMQKAGERASSVGDVEKAANSYIDAAFLAIASGREDKVPALIRKTRAMLTSPLLTADRRAPLLERIEGNPTLAKVDAQP